MARQTRGLARSALLVLTMPLPWGLKRAALSLLLGYRLDRAAFIGLSFIDVEHLSMGPGARIGHLNIVRGLTRFEMGQQAWVGNRNWIGAVPSGTPGFCEGADRTPELILRAGTVLTGHHYLDCSDSVAIGPAAMLAGGHTQILTHTFDLETLQHKVAPVQIGSHSMVNTRCILLCGANVPANTVIAAGGVVTTRLAQELTLYGGVPVRPLKPLERSAAYFTNGVSGTEGESAPPAELNGPAPNGEASSGAVSNGSALNGADLARAGQSGAVRNGIPSSIVFDS